MIYSFIFKILYWSSKPQRYFKIHISTYDLEENLYTPEPKNYQVCRWKGKAGRKYRKKVRAGILSWYARKHGQLARIEPSDRFGSVWFGSVQLSWVRFGFCLVCWFTEGVLLCPGVLVFAVPCAVLCHFGNCADCTVAGQAAASVCFNFSYRQAAALYFPTHDSDFPSPTKRLFLFLCRLNLRVELLLLGLPSAIQF